MFGRRKQPTAAPAASPDTVPTPIPAPPPTSPAATAIPPHVPESSATSSREHRNPAFSKTGRPARFDIQLDRHEAKFVIPARLVPAIRDFILPFCDADPHSQGTPPEYDITTLQLDAPNLALHHAKEHEAVNRFKLRARTYGVPGETPVFLEVKRKLRTHIIKSRTAIPFDAWNQDLIQERRLTFTFRSQHEENGYLDFIRLARQIDARPVTLIKYTRESYMSKQDRYARVSFDRHLLYQPTRSWDSWGRNGRWIPMDNPRDQNKLVPFSGIIMELKSLTNAPRWMIDLVMHFNLVRTGNCKYCTAVWKEALFTNTTGLPNNAVDLLSF